MEKEIKDPMAVAQQEHSPLGTNEHQAFKVHFQVIESDCELMSEPVAGYQKTKHAVWTKMKSILKPHKAPTNHGPLQGEKVLHESIVLASHLYWSLKNQDMEDKDENGDVKLMKMIEYLSVPSWNELSPFSFAPNREFLTSGCPTFHRLRKIPQIDFPKSPQSSTDVSDQAGSDVVHEEQEGSSVPFDVDASSSASAEKETQLNVVRESKTLAIDPHAHLLQSSFQQLETAATHKKPSVTQHKVVLRMQASGLEPEDILMYLREICKVQEMCKGARITDLQHLSTETTCIFMFPSINSAKRFKSHMDKIEKDTECHAEMYNQKEDPAEGLVGLQKRLDAVMRENVDALAVHQEKLKGIDEKLKKTQEKKTKLSEMNHVLEERQAFLQKQQELKNQEQEFLSFTNIFHDQFIKIPPTKNWKAKASVLEKRNQIEKDRLYAALPMYAKRTEIVKMIAENQVSILLGETGSGKSTQVTQYLYEAGLAGQKKIVCTQPRKVAATSLAKRVAEEMHSELGGVIGFKVGMQREFSKETRILYMTDHMLLKECLDDPLLTKYSCLIIDEAHERSLNTDLLLGMIKKALVHRPELRVVITSATINPSVFVTYFNGCPVLKVSGRVFPVEVFYSDEPADPDSNFVRRAVDQALDVALCKDPGDTLVFLTTPLETEKACEMMIKRWPNNKNQLLCVALHSKTQHADQQIVFNSTPQGQHKVVFATNSAETSVTIPGIKVVIDTGLAKEKMYDPTKNMSSLKVCKISQSSADQRKGRAGRTEKGKCYRLYTEEDYDTMDPTSKPEILRVHLGMALLQLLSFKIEDPLSFDFVEMPPCVALEKAMNVLLYLGAVGKDRKLTPLGKNLAAMSLEPRMGKLVLNGIEQGIGFECLLVASFSTVGGNMFYRGGSESNKQQADKLKVRFCNLRGDIYTMLDVYKEWNKQPEKAKINWCMENSINSKSMRMLRESVKEIQATLTQDLGIKMHQKFHSNQDQMEALLETVIAESYAMNLCVFAGHESLGYMMVTDLDTLVHVHPSSALKTLAKSPRYIAFENTLTTSRAFVINITCVSDETIKKICQRGNLEINLDEVNKQVVSSAIIDTVGKSTITKICGPRHSTRLMLEKDLQVYFNTEKLTLETNADVGTVTVFALPDILEECVELVKKMVLQEQECLYQEEIERPLEDGCTTRVIIGHGGQTKNLLFANEFRSLFIRSVPEQYSKEQLIESFREVAVVTDFDDRKGLRVVFDQPEAAKEVLELLNEGREEDLILPGIVAKLEMTVGAKGISPPPLQNVSLKLTWCRRPNRGIAFVKFPSQNTDFAGRALAIMSHVTIDGHICPVKLSSKSPEELFIVNIPKRVANNDIANMVKDRIKQQTSFLPKDVVVPNEAPFETTQSDCAQFKKIIETRIKQEAPEIAAVEVSMRPPTEKAVQYVAFVNLKNGIHADALFNALRDMTILGIHTQVNMTLKTFIVVRQEILPYVRDEVDDVVFELEGSIEGLNCHGEVMRRDPADYRIDISARSAVDLAKAREQITKCIEGKHIDIENPQHLQYFKYTQKGQQFMKRVQQQCHVHVTVDQNQSFIVLRGGNHDIRKATMQIDEQIVLLNKSDTKTYNLKELYPPGMTKRLMGIYGLDLEDLVRASSVEMIELQLRNHLLIAHGTPESITIIEQLMKIHEMALAEKTPKDTDKTPLPDCPVCFCEVEGHDMYCLEYCAHVYCGSCMKGLVEHGIKDRSFPIQCATENCGKDIIMKDLFALVGTSMDQLSPFLKSSLDCYVKTQGKALKYCITPDCGMVYPTDRGDMEVCGLCQVKICTMCDSEHHPGISCDSNKMMKDKLQGTSFDEYSKETWLAEDTKNRALCPKCKSGIEKNGGCKRVQCIQCSVHICWGCKASFGSSKETYDHLAAECGGIFD